MASMMNVGPYHSRVKKAMEHTVNSSLFPRSYYIATEKASESLSCPSLGIILGRVINVQYCKSYSFAKIEDTDWIEPLLTWPIMFMPSGTRKSQIHSFTINSLEEMKSRFGDDEIFPSFTVQECTVEKLGRSLAENNGQKMWFLDECDSLFFQIGTYSKDKTVSREETVLLQAYNGSSWKHETVGRTSFSMKKTSLLVGGLTQTKTAFKILQDDKTKSGLLPRFLFYALEPVFAELDNIKPIKDGYKHDMLKTIYLCHNERASGCSETKYELKRSSPAYLEFRRFYQSSIEDIKSTCFQGNHELKNYFQGKLPGKVIRLAATFTCIFSNFSEECRKEMQNYKEEQAIIDKSIADDGAELQAVKLKGTFRHLNVVENIPQLVIKSGAFLVNNEIEMCL